jgi:hypothetical protein
MSNAVFEVALLVCRIIGSIGPDGPLHMHHAEFVGQRRAVFSFGRIAVCPADA